MPVYALSTLTWEALHLPPVSVCSVKPIAILISRESLLADNSARRQPHPGALEGMQLARQPARSATSSCRILRTSTKVLTSIVSVRISLGQLAS